MTIVFITLIVVFQFFETIYLTNELTKRDEEIRKLKGPYNDRS